jgi:hypothetical protein
MLVYLFVLLLQPLTSTRNDNTVGYAATGVVVYRWPVIMLAEDGVKPIQYIQNIKL